MVNPSWAEDPAYEEVEMERDELVRRLDELARECREEFLGAAGVLFCLAGSVEMGVEDELCRYTAPFTQRKLAEIDAIKGASQARMN